jgi:hypothetical protein
MAFLVRGWRIRDLFNFSGLNYVIARHPKYILR